MSASGSTVASTWALISSAGTSVRSPPSGVGDTARYAARVAPDVSLELGVEPRPPTGGVCVDLRSTRSNGGLQVVGGRGQCVELVPEACRPPTLRDRLEDDSLTLAVDADAVALESERLRQPHGLTAAVHEERRGFVIGRVGLGHGSPGQDVVGI